MLKLFKINADKASYPCNNKELIRTVRQAHDNNLKIKYNGGSFPSSKDASEALTISLKAIKRLLSYDPLTNTILVEPGMTLKDLVTSMEYLNYTLDIYGTLPNMAVSDAINVGLIGSNGSISHCLKSCQVIQPDMTISEWTWPQAGELLNAKAHVTHDTKLSLQALVCSLGITGVITKCTFKCVPMKFAQEIVFHTDLDNVANQLYNLSESMFVNLHWFPLLSKVIVNKASLVLMRNAQLQPWWLKCVEQFCWCFHWFTHRISPCLSWYFTGHATLLSYMQFLLMSGANMLHTEYSYKPQTFVSVRSYCRGIKWIFPLDNFESTIKCIESWSKSYPYLCTTPLLISLQKHQDLPTQRPYLSPYSAVKTFTVWSDWFRSSSIGNTYSKTMAEFEALLQKNGGRKCWSAGPVYVSPLIGQLYPGFRHFCETCALLDPTMAFRSSYVEGDIFGEQY